MSSPKTESKTQLYISNLPQGATSERLEAAFKKYGEITDAFIPHRGSRFGFVDFSDAAAAAKGLEMNGKALDAEAAKDTPEDKISVVRATVRPKEKERKPPAAKEAKPAKEESKKGGDGEKSKGAKSGEKKKKDEGSKPDYRGAAAKGASEAPKEKGRGGGGSGIDKKMLDNVADKFFKAVSEQDWESAGACFAPSSQCFSPQRTGAKPQQFAEFKKTMGGMIGLLGKPKYLNVRRMYAVDGVTEQHTTRFAEKPEATVEAEACVLLRINSEGLIVRMDEYLDPTVVLKAVQSASRK